MKKISRTKKGAASIYIVIFTTTLLGVIALSFVRIMIAESLRTTNYSLSQSAYNSALAGIEDAKIVLLRNQNCINYGSYSSGTRKYKGDCDNYKRFWNEKDALETARDCDIVGKLLHGTKEAAMETVIQTSDSSTDVVDQAYTCVKISTYTDDFLAVLGEHASTKIIPLRTEDIYQDGINRIQIQWFDEGNYNQVSKDHSLNTDVFAKFGNGLLSSNNASYDTTSDYGNSFGNKAIVPPPMQVTFIQTGNYFSVNNFYTSVGLGTNNSKTNRGTLFLRPTSNTAAKPADGFSNTLPRDSLAYSANKSFNTPIDVYCNLEDIGTEKWGNYSCSADFYIPPSIEGGRNRETTYLIVSLPYNKPETDIAVKMYECSDDSPISSENCTIRKFAGVQPMVDSTGRANDLFRRVESRIELADTSFPISTYALADTNPNGPGVQKNFYVTTPSCNYSTSTPSGAEVKKSDGTNNMSYSSSDGRGDPGTQPCNTAAGLNGQ